MFSRGAHTGWRAARGRTVRGRAPGRTLDEPGRALRRAGAGIDSSAIATRIREFLEAEFAGQGNDLTDTTNLLDDFFVDSFGIIDTVMFLESSFGIQIRRADINGENFRDVAALSAFVAGRMAE